ncbi:uncharacterized protein LOC126778418 isoform X4 [Nymphalis io]|uniref:uncharacterized protein LOC126778418 isoform X4 n=1 Tax=Inachis io TaxID=171585 RepID=UPI002167642A|nr:uncharacterized protein LOC126778418 isoform X4 [Nymphalis io]
MMITIHGLPVTTKYQDLKVLIKQECNIHDFILDCLVHVNDGTKKVRVGLANDSEGNHIIKCLNGYRMSGNTLRLFPVGKSAVNPPLKPQFESRDTVPISRGSQETPPYGYNPKSNLINLGPKETYQRNIPSTLKEIPVASRPFQSSRYSTQNYEMQTEKPVTIMKDNFQGPSQYDVASIHSQGSGNYPVQIQPSHWGSQQQQKQFEKPSMVVYDKKLYDDRKYPQVNLIKSMPEVPSKSEDPYKAYDKSRQFSPPRRAYGRDMAHERRISPSDRDVSHAGRSILPGRRSPGRRISPPGRQSVYPDRRSPGRRVSPGRHSSPPNRTAMLSTRDISPSERRISPSARHIPPSGRHVSPGRRLSPSVRRLSPSGRPIMPTERLISPHGRRFSPPGRQPAQVRQVSPPGSKMSPLRKPSPSHRRISPQVKQEEYTRGRRVSPPTHSPMDRRVASCSSPSRVVPRGMPPHGRQDSPRRQGRYSPPRHHPENSQEYQDERRVANIKSVRPAYEPQSQASDEAIYSGGYRHNVREDVKYPVSRQDWQDREKPFPPNNIIEDRRDVSRLQKFDVQRPSDHQRPLEQEPKRSRSRTSRSPRRERSPLRDRYKRHSPSPRSPRRSWALEKRRSPESRDPPPPPAWPAQDGREDYSHITRSKNHERQIEKHVPVWEPREKKRDDYSAADNRRDFEEEIRIRKEAGKWKPLPLSSPQESSSRLEDNDRIQKEYTRKDFEGHRGFICEDVVRKPHSDSVDKGYQRQDHEDTRYKSDHERKHDIPRKREEYSGRIEEKKKEILEKQEQLQKEIDEVYKRAADFKKKAVMYKKGEHKKEGYSTDRHRDDDQVHNDYEQRYKQDSNDERHKGKEYSKEVFSRSDDAKNSSEIIALKPRFELDAAQKRHALSATIKAKRTRAIDEISEKILCKYASSLPNEVKKRVESELKWTLGRKLYDLFGDRDVSFIEMIVKFNGKYNQREEQNIFDEVVSSLPSQYRSIKRVAQDDSDVPAKNSRRSTEPNFNKDQHELSPLRLHGQQIPDWNVGMMSLNVATNPGIFMNSPFMMPVPAQFQFVPTYQEVPQPIFEENKKDGYSLYLCKDNFQPIEEFETDKLKEFLIQQLIKVTETCEGWAPDFTLNKQNSTYRHEVITRDERSRDWLLGLDFSDFKKFNVLVYTTEELWYERAAIWLPGHSRCRNIDPLSKLKLQNKKLEGVNIGKWKFVKKIVTDKGTRVYVDMPPSSARALEKHKMMLSYELQKVNVFLKAVAIDKDAFDAGLNEASLKVVPLSSNCPMPSLGYDPNIVKIAAKGNKPLSVVTARKIKDIIIFKLFKYHQLNGKSRTDFVKYGFCQPGYLGILPENEESRKWITSIDLGKMNRQLLVIVGADDNKTVYFKMNVFIPRDYAVNTALVYERLRHSNRGVKGVNFSMWKNQKIVRNNGKALFQVEMDLESVETISKMNYQLDYVADGHDIKSVTVDAEYSRSRVEEMITKYRAEMSDTYDVANMELESSDSDDKVICLD